jgi:CheY-like chemotaxis protein
MTRSKRCGIKIRKLWVRGTSLMRYSKVFLIEDDEDDQELFVMALRQINPYLDCTVLSGAYSALQVLEQNEAAPDLIFLDLNMPVMTGQQFLAELRKRHPGTQIPIVVLSTSSNQAIIDEAKALGARSFITKPNNFRELKNILQRILD